MSLRSAQSRQALLQQDTVGGFAPRPSSLDRFTYAENNPATFTDPSGQFLGPLFFWMGVNDVGNAVQRLIRRNILRSCGQLWQDSAWLGLSLLLVGMDVAALKGEVRAAGVADDLGDEARLGRGADDADPGLGNCLNSFTADTPVATADGEQLIGDIAVGDQVLAYDAATGATGSYTVTATINHTDQLLVEVTLDGEDDGGRIWGGA